MSETQWYVAIQGRQEGPFAEAEGAAHEIDFEIGGGSAAAG